MSVTLSRIAITALVAAGIGQAAVPPDVAAKLREMGRGVCPAGTAILYKPMQLKAPAGVKIERDIKYESDARTVLDVFSGEKGGGSRTVLIYVSGGAGNKIEPVPDGDAFYDNLDKVTSTELREGYFDFTAAKWDARVGRQIVTWGVGDLLFINDIFPKDYAAFFSGRPLEYLKRGVDAAKVGVYPAFASAEFIAIPSFEPNNYPDPRRFSLYDPLSGIANREVQDPYRDFKKAESLSAFDTSSTIAIGDDMPFLGLRIKFVEFARIQV